MIGGVILYLGLFQFEVFFLGDNRPFARRPQILMLSVPNYLFHGYLLWLSPPPPCPLGNHETDVLA